MKYTPWIIIIVLILMLFLQRECHRCPKCPEVITTTDTCYIAGDTVIRELPAVIPPIPDSIIPQPIPADIDSAAIAKIFFSKVYGYAVLVDDSSMYAGFKYMIEQNRLMWFIPNVANRKTTAIIHNTTVIESVEPRNKWFVGLGLSVYDTIPGMKQNNMAPSLHVSFALITKKDHLYSTTIDPFREYYTATIYYKLKWPFKKK